MRLRLLTLLSFNFFILFQVYGKFDLDEVGNYIVAGDLVTAEAMLSDYENNIINISNDSMCYFYYVKGIFLEQKGDTVSAIASFIKSYKLGRAYNYHNERTYYDTMVRIMNLYYNNQDFDSCARIGLEAIKMSEETLAWHPATLYFFSMLVQSLSNIMKYGAIPDIVRKGLPFVQKNFSPNEELFYELPFQEAYAYLCMQKIEKADSVLQKLNREYLSTGTKLQHVENGLNRLSQDIKKLRKENWKQDAIESIHSLENIIFVNPTTPEGSKVWKQYLHLLRYNLEYLYLDPNDVEDESFWHLYLAQLLVHFYAFCHDLPGRAAESYNNILLKKNFFEYHTANLYKKPYTWEDVMDMLDNNEVAVEISQMPDEILILRKGIDEPLSIPIDSLLFNELACTDIHDAVAVNNLYSQNGALNRLWMTIEPYLDGINTVYISPSHVFGQFNYSAIPLSSIQRVSDKYLVKNVLSTADIRHVKECTTPSIFKNALLVGGVDYDVPCEVMVAEAAPYRKESSSQEWALTRGIFDETRGYLRYLPGSMAEVHVIDSILKKENVNTVLLTGISANEEAVKNVTGSKIDLLHISTHGFMLAPLFFSEQGQKIRETIGSRYQTILSQSGIFLAGAKSVWNGKEKIPGVDDGILTSREIMSINLNGVKLAVLSACDTGLGDQTNLTGASFGVHYAFKLAGVDKLLVCLWQVDDSAAKLFMELFYNSLLSCNSLADAITNARNGMIESGYDDPYYWAPFIIIE